MMRGFRLALSSTTNRLERVGPSLSNPGGGSPPTLALFAQVAADTMTVGGDEDSTTTKRERKTLTDADIAAMVVTESQRVFNALLDKLDKRKRMKNRERRIATLNAYDTARRAGAALRRRLMKGQTR